MTILGQPERRLETTFGFYQFWLVLTSFDQFWDSATANCNLGVSSCLSQGPRQTKKLSQVGCSAVSEFPLTTPGNSATNSLTQIVLISWGSSTQPQHSNEQPDSQLEPSWWRLTAAVVFHSPGISLNPKHDDLNCQSVRVTLLYQQTPSGGGSVPGGTSLSSSLTNPRFGSSLR